MEKPPIKVQQRVASYFRKAARSLGIRDCEIRVQFEPTFTPSQPIWADTNTDDLESPLIRWGWKFLQASEKEQREVVAHELVHVRLRRMSAPAREVTRAIGKTGGGYWLWYCNAEEDVCNALEVPLARLLPEPRF